VLSAILEQTNSPEMRWDLYEDADFPLYLGIFHVSREILATYTNIIFLYIKCHPKLTLKLTTPKVHILPHQFFIQIAFTKSDFTLY